MTLQMKIVVGISVIFIGGIFFFPPVPQDQVYHDFADQRTLFGVAHFWNVITNLPFIIIGLMGVHLLLSGLARGGLPELNSIYLVFFAGLVLVGIGSTYYHFDPGNARLVWDRLAMSVSFMAFFCIVVGENISPVAGRRLLLPFITVGGLSVVYWYVSELRGGGDLRPYILVQFLPIILMPVILILYKSRLTHSIYIWAVIGLYLVAKIFELADAYLYQVSGMMSGHPVKHLFAAFAALVFYWALRSGRRPLATRLEPLS